MRQSGRTELLLLLNLLRQSLSVTSFSSGAPLKKLNLARLEKWCWSADSRDGCCDGIVRVGSVDTHFKGFQHTGLAEWAQDWAN
ncbi:hypothetical protein K438DRAFT_1813831 [Mycena galopus ATCC 62051]|nr:hypothetical protein K438DRAFT_1813831 [Mycena galopus ATCC 62051]